MNNRVTDKQQFVRPSIGRLTNTRNIVSTLPGYNQQTTKKKNALWNTDFQTYNPPMAYRVLEQDKKGGAIILMIGAAILGLIIAVCVGAI